MIALLVTSVLAIAAPAGAATITEFPVPRGLANPNAIATGGDRALWLSVAANLPGDGPGALLRFDPATRAFRIRPEPSGEPGGIVAASTGTLVYTTGISPARVIAFDPVRNVRRVGTNDYSSLFELSAGPGGLVYANGSKANRHVLVGINSNTGGAAALAELGGGAGSSVGSLVAVPDGSAYFLAGGAPGFPLKVITYSPVSGSSSVVATVGGIPPNSYPSSYAGVRALDGRLYFGVAGGGADGVVRFDPSTRAVQFIAAPPGAEPRAMVIGPDSAVWYVGGSFVVRMAPATGATTAYAVPSGQTRPLSGLTVGPDRALWFSEFAGGNIGRIDLGGDASVANLRTALGQGLGALVEVP